MIILGPPVDLLLQKEQIALSIRRLDMLFRKTGDTDAKIAGFGVGQIVLVTAFIQRRDLSHKVPGKSMTVLLGQQYPAPWRRIPPQGEYVAHSEIMKIDQRVLGLIPAETAAEKMHDRLDRETAPDRRADADRPRFFANMTAKKDSVLLFVYNLRLMVRNVHELQPVGKQFLNQSENIFDGPPPARAE